MSANGDGPTPDLLDTLARIQREAKATQEKLAAGEAKNGVSSLWRIEKEAADAIARAKETTPA